MILEQVTCQRCSMSFIPARGKIATVQCLAEPVIKSTFLVTCVGCGSEIEWKADTYPRLSASVLSDQYQRGVRAYRERIQARASQTSTASTN